MCVSHFPTFSVSSHIPEKTVFLFLFQHFFQVSHHIPDPTVCISHFPMFSVFLDIFQDKQCFCFFFNIFSFFSPYSRSYSVHFSFSNLFSVSSHIPGPTVCISTFSVFLTIFQVLQCVFLIVRDFLFSRHTPGSTVCIFILQVFHYFLPYTNSKCFCLIFQVFKLFSPYSRTYSMHFSFSTLFSVPCHISHPTVCFSHFPFIFSFFAILQLLQCAFLIFHVFQCLLPYYTSYSVCFSFSMIFSFLVIIQAQFYFFPHIPGPTVCISNFPRF